MVVPNGLHQWVGRGGWEMEGVRRMRRAEANLVDRACETQQKHNSCFDSNEGVGLSLKTGVCPDYKGRGKGRINNVNLLSALGRVVICPPQPCRSTRPITNPQPTGRGTVVVAVWGVVGWWWGGGGGSGEKGEGGA